MSTETPTKGIEYSSSFDLTIYWCLVVERGTTEAPKIGSYYRLLFLSCTVCGDSSSNLVLYKMVQLKFPHQLVIYMDSAITRRFFLMTMIFVSEFAATEAPTIGT